MSRTSFPVRVRIALPIPLAALLIWWPGSLQQSAADERRFNAERDWSEPGFWNSLDGRPVEENWDFVDGELRLARPRGSGGSLLSKPLPANFELSFEWKIEEKANTGVKYRLRKYGNRWLGLEYQIIDRPILAGDKGATASIYDLVAPSPQADVRPPGQWNQARIVAVGHRIEHYLNGELVAQVRTQGVPWQIRLAQSKFWGYDGFGQPADEDRVMLTDHGGRASYRKFKFVEREATGDARSPESGSPFLGNAMRNSWAGQNSIVLWTRTTASSEMVEDGPDFLPISHKEASALSRERDAEKLLNVQLPSGKQLQEMLGACPGASGEVRLTYFPALRRRAIRRTDWVRTSADSDYTAQWELKELQPGSEYVAIIEARPIGGQDPTAMLRGGFQTAAPAGAAEDVTFCMTTCHDFIRRDDGLRGHKIYPAMSEIDPDFVVHAGDIEYYDKPAPWALTIELMRFKWQRIFSLPNNRDFYQRTTSYFLKDDHDTLKNDCWAGQRYGAVTFEQGQALFNDEQFPSHPTRYKTVRWGRDLQVWFLEGRDYRSPNNMPDGPEKTILGAEQKAWLKRTLSESDAVFKLVFSPTPIVGPDRANKRDNHANDTFVNEGDELRGEFGRHDGLIVLCGDRHWQYASVDEETGLWEFGCGPGSEEHELGWKKGDERPIHRFLRVAGGFLSGELSYSGKADSPTLTIRHRKVSGEPVSEFVFPVAVGDEIPSDRTDQ